VANRVRTGACRLVLAAAMLGVPLSAARAQSVEELRQLSIEQLANLNITSVSRRPEPLSEAPASVYVITHDDIHRSAAVTLPELLRLAPNLEVARQDGPNYAVSARGFNSASASNKLLVMVDGRSVYSPLHSGVFWDQLQVPLDDIDRIEVISGPGGTLWGANAVNGVINVITKNSADTQGVLVNLKAGPVDQNGLVQYGGRFGEHGTYRAYGMGFGVGHTDLPGGHSANDDWHGAQAGFRSDWLSGPDNVTVEGDYYRNNSMPNTRQLGGDLLGHWSHAFTDGSRLDVQTSFDRQSQSTTGISDSYDSYDLQAQHTFGIGRHLVVWGGEFRVAVDQFINRLNTFTLVPPSRNLSIGDAFLQDTITLTDALKLTIGTKLEYSSYVGFDYLPSIRLGWRVSDTHFVWAAVSRAVRTPSRIDRDLQAPGFLLRAPNFESEKLIAYELGYRGRPTPDTSISVSLYWNEYSDLRTVNLVSSPPPLLRLGNAAEGHAYGIEAWGDWRVLPWWRLRAGINLLHKDLHTKPGATDTSNGASEGDDPGYQVSLRSSMDLPHNIALDIGVRAVDRLPRLGISSYIEGDARIAWQVTPALELSLAGYNLFGARHAETVTLPALAVAARRSVYLGLRWTY